MTSMFLPSEMPQPPRLKSPQVVDNGDALFPLARFQQHYRFKCITEEEKKRRLQRLASEERRNGRWFPWQEAEGDELVRYHMAAVVIQSQFRAWKAKQELHALRVADETRKQEEHARERTSVVRLLRQQAKDMLLTMYAQNQYSKTRERLLSSTKRRLLQLSQGDVKIDKALWERAEQLGMDPLDILAGHLTAKQIKMVLSASGINIQSLAAEASTEDSQLFETHRTCVTFATSSSEQGSPQGPSCPPPKTAMSESPSEVRSEPLAMTLSQPLLGEVDDVATSLPVRAASTSLDCASLEWPTAEGSLPSGGRTVKFVPARISRHSNPGTSSVSKQPPPPPLLTQQPDSSKVDAMLRRASLTTTVLTLPSPTVNNRVSSIHGMGSMPYQYQQQQRQPTVDATPPPLMYGELKCTSKGGRPPPLKLNTVLLQANGPTESPKLAQMGGWVLSPTGVISGRRSSCSGKSPSGLAGLSLSADGLLTARGPRRGSRAPSYAGQPSPLAAQHSEGDFLFSCAGSKMARTRMSESGATFSLPPLPQNRTFRVSQA